MEEEGHHHNNTLVDDHYKEDYSTSTPPENGADSPLSDGEAVEPVAPPPKKRRKDAHKRVVSVPIGGAGTKGDVYPPPDSWSWRKYGQKPIKGSPYPRGYYRCSSLKGCLARKQVERNRLDSTILIVTYFHEHNHPVPTTNKHHHRNSLTTATTSSSTTSTSSITTSTDATTDAVLAKTPPEDLEFAMFSDLTGELGWFSDMGSTTMLESTTTFMAPNKWAEADIAAVMLPIKEEDQTLFGDLGELPECSMVFRQPFGAQTSCYGGTE